VSLHIEQQATMSKHNERNIQSAV